MMEPNQAPEVQQSIELIEPPVVHQSIEPKTALAVAEENTEQNVEEAGLQFSALPAEEQKKVQELSSGINLSDSTQVMQYGAAIQSKIAGFSDSILQNIRTKDTGEIGKSLTNLVVEIKGFNATEQEKKGGGLLGKLFGGADNVKGQVNKLLAGYSKVETNIDKITDELEGHKRQLLKDNAVLDTMYQNNYDYFKELSLYIIAGQQKLKEFRQTDIPRQRQLAEASNNQMDAQRLNDMNELAERFDKKLHDLKLSRMVSIQMAPQIRLIQNNNAVLTEKIQSSLVNSIPLWKNQMVIAMGLANSKSALAAQTKVTDMTNELLLKNSEMLKQGSIEIAKESERSIVSIETIQKTNNNLISTIQEVLDIQKKGSEERAAAETELGRIEGELKQALLNASQRKQ